LRHIFYLQLAIILLLVAFTLLLMLPVQIRIVYEIRGRGLRGQVKVGIFKGRVGLKISFPQPRKIPDGRPGLARSRDGGSYKFPAGINRASISFLVQWRRWRDLLTGIRRGIGVLKLFRSSVCSRLLWKTGFGLDDYAATGMITGLIWAGKGLVMGMLGRYLRIRPAGVQIAVVPQFGSTFYASNLDCILETSLGHIILVAFKLGVIWLVQNPGLLRGGLRRYA
jgi:hypothetical protein